MASPIVGRIRCLGQCGFEAAHVRESEKCLYHYCPECGINGPHFRTPEQKANIRRAMRPVGEPAPTPTGTPTPSATPAPAGDPPPPAAPQPTPTPTPTPTPVKRRPSLW